MKTVYQRFYRMTPKASSQRKDIEMSNKQPIGGFKE